MSCNKINGFHFGKYLFNYKCVCCWAFIWQNNVLFYFNGIHVLLKKNKLFNVCVFSENNVKNRLKGQLKWKLKFKWRKKCPSFFRQSGAEYEVLNGSRYRIHPTHNAQIVRFWIKEGFYITLPYDPAISLDLSDL